MFGIELNVQSVCVCRPVYLYKIINSPSVCGGRRLVRWCSNCATITVPLSESYPRRRSGKGNRDEVCKWNERAVLSELGVRHCI